MENNMMITQLVTTGGPAWWGVLIVVSLLMTATVHGRRPSGTFAGVLLIGLVAFLFLFGDTWSYVWMAFGNPLGVLIGVGIYLGLGLIWAVVRWLLFVRDELREDRPLPKPKDYLEELTVWAAYWPWSAAGQFYALVLRDVWQWIIRRLTGVLEWLTIKLFGGK